MNNSLATVFYDMDEMRTVVIDKEIWWSIIDVCNVIGVKNSRDVYKKLDEDEKNIFELEDTIGRKQEIQIVNEFGLYHILLTARSEKAKPFRRWVTHDVLPRIRKYGYYKLSVDERKSVAYKKIVKLRGEEELANKEYEKMSVNGLEMKVRSFEAQDALEIERAEIVKKYPYTYDEADKWCRGELEYVRLFIPKGEEDKYYEITGGFFDSREHFSEKFRRDVPKLMKKAYKG